MLSVVAVLCSRRGHPADPLDVGGDGGEDVLLQPGQGQIKETVRPPFLSSRSRKSPSTLC